ncbi:methyltransferase domain-containing protein [Helicobacter sp. 11S03491-1]|uniref:class I SAM-dependent methyltransferase n=1 Tax=Helicobacter sp. 11S03491-1 TaxID=1476196 RepID=UPI000BA65C4A|nr:methyltransferase domain-containing protein [Helicobacter sp. 11S03491-1]PAF43886.1 hypothetical protein BKH45_01080 [Helicobacter sp. 11S03491-1]
MKEDALKWDKKYKQDLMPTTPSDFLINFVQILPVGRVLDIACGNGRNTKFLAQKGFVCECVDISQVGLLSLKNIKNTIPICCDLDNYEIKTLAYDVILNFYFLDRRLFEGISKGLKCGGVLLMETFIEDKDFPTDIAAQKILQKGELEKAFHDFEILHKQEKIICRNQQKAKVIEFAVRKS